MPAGDAGRLAHDLHRVLPEWDPELLLDVAGSIVASSPAEVADIAQNVLGGVPGVRHVLAPFLPSSQQPLGPAAATSPTPGPLHKRGDGLSDISRQYGSSGATSSSGSAVPATSGSVHSEGSSRPAPAGSAAVTSTVPGGGKVLGLFKQGGRIKTGTGKGAGGGKDGGGVAALVAALERHVVNCLGCGKIYDCRNTTNPDIVRFLERAGTCTFCGKTVSLTYAPGGGSSSGAVSGAITAAVGPAPDPSSPPAPTEADQVAQAFKDRLVLYDRESAKRTTVIDDQSDYFEVDTNAWLTDEERRQLREQRRMEAEAEAARRSRVAVTIDLLGRRVVVADSAGAGAAGVSFRTGGDALQAEAPDARQVDTQGAMWQGSATSGPRPAAHAGPLDPGALTLAAAESLRELRATANPNIRVSKPQFVPTAGQARPGRRMATKAGKKLGADAAPPPAGNGPARLQGSLTEAFDVFLGEQAAEDSMRAAGRDVAAPV